MELLIIVTSFFLMIPYSVLILYYRQSWISMPPFINLPGNPDPTMKITVIIPARNEAANMRACLDSVTNQSYPPHLYQVLVIDDHSTDATAAIIKSFAGKNVQLISLKDFTEPNAINSYKKKAIEIAIQQSSGQLIVTTDADCIVPPKWLETISQFYEKTNAVFIAAPVAFACENTFLQIFQALDFMTLQGITGASVYKKIHSMCNGANLAYEKKAFIEVGGFKGIDAIASGDDMLLMHKIYKQYPQSVFFLKSTEAIVHANPMPTLKDFFNQRIRWASKAGKYDDKRIFTVLLLVYILNAWILVMGICCLIAAISSSSLSKVLMYNFFNLLVCKTIIELFFLYPVARFFNNQILLWWFPLAQPFHIVYTVIAGWLGKFGSYHWKERKVK